MAYPESAWIVKVNVPGKPDSVLNAATQTSAPTYVVELIDQPHIFAGPAWEDANGWELLLANAHLKDAPAALEKLKSGLSMQEGNADKQHFDYQKWRVCLRIPAPGLR